MFLPRKTAACHGFTLVEVMVTLFIVAVGVLGVTGLQLASMRSNHSAFLRSQATLAAYALTDRVRTDPASFRGVKFDTNKAAGNASFQAWVEELEHLAMTEPETDPLGELDCSNGNACNSGHCAITIRWNDARGEDTALAQTGRDAKVLEFLLCTRVPQ
jgi:type IV pilus assembly protein PilV